MIMPNTNSEKSISTVKTYREIPIRRCTIFILPPSMAINTQHSSSTAFVSTETGRQHLPRSACSDTWLVSSKTAWRTSAEAAAGGIDRQVAPEKLRIKKQAHGTQAIARGGCAYILCATSNKKGELPQELPRSQASRVSATRSLNILYTGNGLLSSPFAPKYVHEQYMQKFSIIFRAISITKVIISERIKKCQPNTFISQKNKNSRHGRQTWSRSCKVRASISKRSGKEYVWRDGSDKVTVQGQPVVSSVRAHRRRRGGLRPPVLQHGLSRRRSSFLLGNNGGTLPKSRTDPKREPPKPFDATTEK